MLKSIVREALLTSVTCAARPVSFQTSQESTVPNASSPASARARAPCNVVENPRDLAAGKIRVDDEAGALARPAAHAPSAFRRSQMRRRAPILPDDGVAMTGSPVSRSHTIVVSRWLVMPIAATSCGRTPARPSASTATASLRRPDLLWVVLDPPRARKDLGELLLRNRHDRAVVIEHDGARARGALVESEYVRQELHGSTTVVLAADRGEQRRAACREVLAEFLGTFVLIVFGVGVVAQVVLSQQTAGTFLSINLAWGLAVTMGCYVAGGVSGAHLNPAVTIALAVHRGFPWNKVAPVCDRAARRARSSPRPSSISRIADALRRTSTAASVRSRARRGPAGIWATYPQAFLSTFPGGFIDQVVGTALLMAVILAVTDARNSPPASGMAPVIVGLLVAVIGMSFGFNAGYAINPARDFGPRLFTAVGGWGVDVFRAANGWWWVPIVAPVVGAVLGGAAYDALIGNRFPKGTSPGFSRSAAGMSLAKLEMRSLAEFTETNSTRRHGTHGGPQAFSHAAVKLF